MSKYRIIDEQESSSKFFVSSGLDDWSLEHHEDLLKIEEYLKTNPDCKLVAIEFQGEMSNA
jgi:hypothetical protein